jgi:23S rRNA pseudouridine1911/1915/1917 synthase
VNASENNESLPLDQTPSPNDSDKSPIELTIQDQDSGKRVDAFLAELYPGHSRTYLSKSIKNDQASLNGLPVKPSTILKAGERLIFLPPIPKLEIRPIAPIPLPLNIIHQDQDIIVINKQADLAVHPAESHFAPTLADGLLFLEAGLAEVGDPERPGLVHRLDKDTTGAMVVARNVAAYEILVKAFHDREVGKTYLAFVRGPIPDSGRIDQPISRNPRQRHKMQAGPEYGRVATSLFKVVKRFPRTGVALVSIALLTGRTHQARVHLAHLGFPILADRVYGKKNETLGQEFPALEPLLKRQFLHARRLVIPHPAGGRRIFWAPWPEDFKDLLKELLRLEKESL